MKKKTIPAVVLALLVPGAGHLYLGRRHRAAVFFSIVMFMFFTGLAIDGKLYESIPGQTLSLLATIGSMGVGLPYFLVKASGWTGNVISSTFEYGTAFLLTAGLMNLLLILDSFDIAMERKR